MIFIWSEWNFLYFKPKETLKFYLVKTGRDAHLIDPQKISLFMFFFGGGRLFQFHSFGSDKQKAEVYKKIHGFNNDDSLYNWIETNMKGL